MHSNRIALHCIIPPHMSERSPNMETMSNGIGRYIQWGYRSGATAVPAGEKRRTIYGAKHAEHLPGALMREGDPKSKDPAVNEAYDGAGATYDFYQKVYERNSVDDRGLRAGTRRMSPLTTLRGHCIVSIQG